MAIYKWPMLEDSVALVAGATRGAGRGIAVSLGEAGATVYCTGRSVRGRPATPGRPETLEETAELVRARGGNGIAVRVDHERPEEVAALAERIEREQGRLDLVVNDVWGGDPLTEWGKPFWELDLDQGWTMVRRGLFTHIVTSRFTAPLLVRQRRGLCATGRASSTIWSRRQSCAPPSPWRASSVRTA